MRVCAVEMHIDISKNRFTREFTTKMPQAQGFGTRAPDMDAVEADMDACRKSHFMREF